MTDAPAMMTTDPLNETPRFTGPAQEIAPDVFIYPEFVNSYAVRTEAGLLLIDPGRRLAAPRVHAAIRSWSDLPVHTCVYTHGHLDHAFGLGPFLAAGDRPHIVAQENLPARFHRYRQTQGYNEIINQRQFGDDLIRFGVDQFDWPTLTFRDSLAQTIGGVEVRYQAEKGETDDHCYVWLPQKKYLFCGDLIIWRAPNCGNPQKVQRYPVEWADALERMAALDARWLFPGHGPAVHGEDNVRRVLTETAQYLRHIVQQVLERLNAGQSHGEIVEAVTSDPELSRRPYLLELYDHPQFIVRNLLRRWGGWWNGIAADLLPAATGDQASEIAHLAGGVDALIRRGRELLGQGNSTMAAHLAEWASRAAPADRSAQEFKRDVYEFCVARTENLMAQGVYRYAMNEAQDALGESRRLRTGPRTL